MDDCAVMSRDGFWSDLPCDVFFDHYHYICQYGEEERGEEGGSREVGGRGQREAVTERERKKEREIERERERVRQTDRQTD